MNTLIQSSAARTPGNHSMASEALAAWRAITLTQIAGTILLGLTFSVMEVPVFDYKAILAPSGWIGFLVQDIIPNHLKAFCVLLAFALADRAVEQRGAPHSRYVIALVIGNAVAVWFTALGRMASNYFGLPELVPLHGLKYEFIARYVWIYIVLLSISGLLAYLYIERRRALRMASRVHAAQLERTEHNQRVLESRLQAMQARVEPEFLFETLAQVRRLYAENPALAERILEDLITYLRAAMPHLQGTASTVAREIELVRAYLAVAQVRRGDRSRVTSEVAEGIGEARFPPMLLLPLIDQLIVRGAKSSPPEGILRISVKSGNGLLHVSVQTQGTESKIDDNNTAILRERLAGLYGAAASLVLASSENGEVHADLEIPLEFVKDGAA